jgi:NitT/TauT family transport system substrate-binding protein
MTTLDVGVVQADCTANLFYTQNLGLFGAAGLEVRTQPMPGERDRVHTAGGLTQVLAQAVAGGGLDIGIANVVIVGLARQAGVPLRYLAPAAEIVPAARQIDELFVLRESPLGADASVNGARIAINRPRNLQEVCAREWAALHGADPGSFGFVEVAFEDMGAALRNGDVDIIMTTEPWGTVYAEFARPIGNAFEGIAPRFMALGWFATEDWLAANATTATAFADALRAGSAWANEHHAETARWLAERPNTRVTEELARRMVRARYGLTLEPALIAPLLDVARKHGLLTAGIEPADLIWPPLAG